MAASVYRKIIPRWSFFYSAVIVLVLHGLVILFFANLIHIKPSSFSPSLKMIQLKSTVVESVLVVEMPVNNFQPQFRQPVLPEIEFNKVDDVNIDITQSPPDSAHELSNKNGTLYRNVFDPKLRQKLIDAQGFNTARRAKKPSSWTEADGRTFIDMGDGSCFVSMTKMDSRERGTSWGATRCGKTDSEEMMDRVNADVEARRNPLNR